MHETGVKVIKEFFKGLWETSTFNSLFEKFQKDLAGILEELINTLMKFPTISDLPGVMEIWKFVAMLSIACIGIIYIIPSIKNLISIDDSIIKQMELKKLIPRTLYSFGLIYLTPMYVDTLINFSNLLISVIAGQFPFSSIIMNTMSVCWQFNLISIIIMIIQIFFIIKTVIGYWLRVTETLFLTVASPALFTMWINPAWSGYISSWNRRLIMLIFTSVAQVLVFSIYGKVLGASLSSTSFTGLCLSVATLLLVDNVPQIFTQFMAADNSNQILSKTKTKMKMVNNNPIMNAAKNLLNQKK